MTGDGEDYDTSKATIRVRNPLLEAFDEWVAASEHANRSDALRNMMEAAVGNAPITDGGENREWFAPSDELEREVYQACIEHADDRLRLGTERLAFVAADTKVSVDNLPLVLQRLDGRYVRRYNGRVGVAKPRVHWCIKPPCADPEEWVRGEKRAKERRKARSARILSPVDNPQDGEGATP